MSQYILSKRYVNHQGLDLKSSELTRPIEFAGGITNAQYRKTGSIEKRPGYQAYASSIGGFGLFTYNRVHPTSNLEVQEALSVGSKLYKLNETSIVVTYSGSELTCSISIFYDTASAVYRCQIMENETLVLDMALGTGVDDASTITVTALDTAISALTGFTATITGDGTVSAARLKIVREHELTEGALTATTKYWSEVNCPLASPFGGSNTHKNDSDFENVSSVQINNVIYLANGYDHVMKYDGQNCYRAGLPTPTAPTSALGGAGAITGTNYFHKIQYIQFDAVGNLVEGNTATTATGLVPAAQSINITVNNVLASTGFNTNCAIVAGAQGPVNTITVDDGSGGSHTMEVGDTAYFYDAVSAGYVTREVTAIAATTITVAGAAVTVADNAVISNNLRIGIFRNETSATTPTVFFVVAEIPNNSFTATQVYNDNLADASLGAQFIEPLTDRSPPPDAKYISAFRNQLVLAGDIDAPNTMYWSDVESPEYFPNAGTNQADVQGIYGSTIRGIAPNNEVFVIFQNPGIHVVSGDIGAGNIRVDLVSTDLGCAAHDSIEEIKGVLYFLTEVGPRKMVGGQLPEPLGIALGDSQGKSSRIDPVFDQAGLLEEETLVLRRTVGFHDRKGEKYWLYIPAETETSGANHANSNSRLFAYDYSRDAWLEWSNMDLSAGVTSFDGETLWQERRYSTVAVAVTNYLYRQHNLVDPWDYEDHTSPVTWVYQNQWEALGEPSVLKTFLRVRVFSVEELEGNALTLNVKTEVNYIPGSTKADFTIDFASEGYGNSEYGQASYGDEVEPAITHKLSNGRHKSLRVIFENEVDQENVIVTGWELEIASPYQIALKS